MSAGVWCCILCLDWLLWKTRKKRCRIFIWSAVVSSAEDVSLSIGLLLVVGGLFLLKAIGGEALPACMAISCLFPEVAWMWLVALSLSSVVFGGFILAKNKKLRAQVSYLGVQCAWVIHDPWQGWKLCRQRSIATERVSFHLCALVASFVWFV